MYQVIWNQNL